jgi:hypothetical protein
MIALFLTTLCFICKNSKLIEFSFYASSLYILKPTQCKSLKLNLVLVDFLNVL